MALLALIDHDGSVLSFGAERVPTTPAGLALVAAAARDEAVDLAALAARHGEPVEPLVELVGRLRAWRDRGGDHESPRRLLSRPGRFEPSASAAVDPDALLQVPPPFPLLVTSDGFLAWPPSQGEPMVLTADEAAVLARFGMPRRVGADDATTLPGNAIACDPAAYLRTVQRFVERGLLRSTMSFQPRTASGRGEHTLSMINDRTKRLVRRQAELLAARPARAGRTPVFPVYRAPRTGPPLALGMIFSYAGSYDGGRLTAVYDLVPDWTVRLKSIKRLTADGPGVFLFSNYIWSTAENLEVSRRVKALSPSSLTVHGGPDAPKYPEDRARFLERNPHVDVIVHGEGEVTTAELLDVLGGRLDGDLRALADVPGLTFRPTPGAAPVTTAERPRLTDLDLIPSPFLCGLFDAFKDATSEIVIVETNRGCPYGCTFCDWGSATLSRIRRFDSARVRAELAWVAASGAKVVHVADANFGIFEFDVEIAEELARLHGLHGTPEAVTFSYAKNTVKHVEKIVRTLLDAGIFGQASISIQTFDEPTLDIINRKNIKTARYDDLTTTFRAAKLPVYTDLMLGLPGSTVASTRADLQRCIDRDVMVRTYATQLLTNSPMNAPDYRERWQIRTDANDLLISTSSYTEDDRREMDRLVSVFHAAEGYGTLRQVLRWVAHRQAIPEVDVLTIITESVWAHPERSPLAAWLLTHFLENSTSPGSWPLFYDEVEAILRGQWGDDLLDDEWATVRRVQEALMPERGRQFPDRVELDHDYVAWSWAFSEARAAGLDPAVVVARLSTFGPTSLEVTDPNRVCEEQMGSWHWGADFHYWELGSPLARHLGGRWAPSH